MKKNEIRAEFDSMTSAYQSEEKAGATDSTPVEGGIAPAGGRGEDAKCLIPAFLPVSSGCNVLVEGERQAESNHPTAFGRLLQREAVSDFRTSPDFLPLVEGFTDSTTGAHITLDVLLRALE